jgi:hypothetical protein
MNNFIYDDAALQIRTSFPLWKEEHNHTLGSTMSIAERTMSMAERTMSMAKTFLFNNLFYSNKSVNKRKQTNQHKNKHKHKHTIHTHHKHTTHTHTTHTNKQESISYVFSHKRNFTSVYQFDKSFSSPREESYFIYYIPYQTDFDASSFFNTKIYKDNSDGQRCATCASQPKLHGQACDSRHKSELFENRIATSVTSQPEVRRQGCDRCHKSELLKNRLATSVTSQPEVCGQGCDGCQKSELYARTALRQVSQVGTGCSNSIATSFAKEVMRCSFPKTGNTKQDTLPVFELSILYNPN